MGEIVELAPFLAREQARAGANGRLRLASSGAPSPESRGWRAIEHDDAKRPIRWYHPKYRALIGFVPDAPELVFLDYREELRAWTMGIDELVAGLETGRLPPPEYALDALGRPLV